MNKSSNNAYPGRTVRRDGDQIVVSVPVKFFRRNGRQMIGVPSESGDEQAINKHAGINSPLVAAIAKAYAWQAQLDSGEYATLEELANANKVDRTYVGHILRLTSLSPQIVEQVLTGNEPSGISLRQLRRGVPLLWSEQSATPA
ncbi:MAG: hypothetical protein R3C03_09075 [Pirellulaceae bacterium]